MLPRARHLLLPSILVATVACGDASLDPIEVAEGCPEAPLRGPTAYAGTSALYLVDDFESGDNTLPHLGGRTGSWVLGTDNTSDAVTAEVVKGRCAARGNVAGHFAASGLMRWGANWTAIFRATGPGNSATPYDGTAFTGISFWAAAGARSAPDVGIPVGITTMENAWNSGNCTTCMDFYRKTIRLDRTWQRYLVRFSELAPQGFGVPPVGPLRRDQLVGFLIWPEKMFDIWIDDVRLEP